jgi:hypothetical protein
MEAVSHHLQNYRQNDHVEPSVKFISNSTISIDVGEHLLKQSQTQIRVSAEFVSHRPYHTVKHNFEDTFREGEEAIEVELDECFKKSEEVGTYFWEAVEIAGDQRQTRVEDHVDQLSQKLAVQHPIQLLEDHREQSHELLLLGLGGAPLEVLQQLPKREDEGIENIQCLLQAEVVAVLEQTRVDLDYLALDHAHGLECYEVEDVFALLSH